MTNQEKVSLDVINVFKQFQTGSHTVNVLQDVSMEMSGGSAVVITGPSGSGKSTLLHIIGTLDSPTSGTLKINNREPFELPETELAKFRNKVIGFIFQDHHLLPQYSVLENVLIPTLAFKRNGHDFEARAKELIDRVGLSHRLTHFPAELSGGERQRVAVARALINQPTMLLCDEPTGNLDHSTANAIADLLFELHQEEQNILIVVTHSLDLAGRFSKRLKLIEGKIKAD